MTVRGTAIRDYKDVGVIYGGQLLGFSTMHGLKYLDTQRPAGFMGQPLSFWGDLLGSIGGVIGALYLKAPYSLIAALVGGYLATDLVNHIIRIAAPIAGIAVPAQVAVPAAQFTPGPPVLTQGRYVSA